MHSGFWQFIFLEGMDASLVLSFHSPFFLVSVTPLQRKKLVGNPFVPLWPSVVWKRFFTRAKLWKEQTAIYVENHYCKASLKHGTILFSTSLWDLWVESVCSYWGLFICESDLRESRSGGLLMDFRGTAGAGLLVYMMLPRQYSLC